MADAQLELISEAATFSSLPDDIIIIVVDSLDTPGDLVSLALTCLRLYKIVSPTDPNGLGQLKCRHLSVSIGDSEVFSKLATPAVAKCVRTLRLRGRRPSVTQGWANPGGRYLESDRMKITREDSEPLWPVCSSDRDLNCALVNGTIKRLVDLRALKVEDFRLMSNDPLSSILHSVTPLLNKVSFRLYREIPLLPLNDNAAGVHVLHGEDDTGSCGLGPVFHELEHLSTLEINLQVSEIVTLFRLDSLTTRIAHLLLPSYPNLRFLCLMVPCLPGSHAFDALRFPLLQSFMLSILVDDDQHTTRERVATFLLQHEKLQDVRIRLRIGGWYLGNGALPNLRRLTSPPAVPQRLFDSLPNGKYRPLRWLKMESAEFSRMQCSKLKRISTLLVLDVVCDSAEDVRMTVLGLPVLARLETLGVSVREEDGTHRHTSHNAYMATSTGFLGGHFPHLRRLKGYFNEAELYLIFEGTCIPNTPGKVRGALRRLCQGCPTLRIVDDWKRSEGSSWDRDANENPGLVWPPFDEEWEHSYNWTHRVRHS